MTSIYKNLKTEYFLKWGDMAPVGVGPNSPSHLIDLFCGYIPTNQEVYLS